MAAPGGLAPGSVAESLFREPHRFDFLQAVRVLRALRPESAPAGGGHEPAAEAVRFRSQVSLGFPPSEIVAVDADGGGPPSMTVAFLGLAGAQGPLPRALTEQVMHQARAGDTASRDFLDLFNHRLVGLMYRARARHRPALEPGTAPGAAADEGRRPASDASDAGWVARYLFALMGLGTPGLDGALPGLPRRALLGYAALLADQTRSAEGLERILSGQFGVRARVVPFTGGWMRLEPEDWTRIGREGQNRTLGGDAVLGRRVWDAQGALTVRVGPLSLGEYLRMLPDGETFRALCSLTRFYVGIGLDFTVELVLAGDQVPPARLGTRAGARLGRTSWLRTRPRPPGPAGDAAVLLDPARHGADPAG